MSNHPSEECRITQVRGSVPPWESAISIEAKIVMPKYPERTYLGHGTVLDNEIDADCCDGCPYKRNVYSRSHQLTIDGKPVAAKCTTLRLDSGITGNVVREKGNPYTSNRELIATATLMFQDDTARDRITDRKPAELTILKRLSHIHIDGVVPSGLPCASHRGSRRVRVKSAHNPPIAYKMD